MDLYTERNKIRKPIGNKTYNISETSYAALLDCCKKYDHNLTKTFPRRCHDDFTDRDYITFNQSAFDNYMKIKIPTLFRDRYGTVSSPTANDEYDQNALLDFIEFIAGNIKDISEGWNDQQYRNYWNIDCKETDAVFEKYQHDVNEIFAESALLYKLTQNKIIERISENSPLIQEVTEDLAKAGKSNLQALLDEAISLYKARDPRLNKLAVEKIWDALENLSKCYFGGNKKKQNNRIVSETLASGDEHIAELFEKELKELGNIGNKYHIRHFNGEQQALITDSRHFDYLFNRCLSLVALAKKYI